MPDYRRNQVPGGTFFFTVNRLDRRSDLLVTQIERQPFRPFPVRLRGALTSTATVQGGMHCAFPPYVCCGKMRGHRHSGARAPPASPE